MGGDIKKRGFKKEVKITWERKVLSLNPIISSCIHIGDVCSRNRGNAGFKEGDKKEEITKKKSQKPKRKKRSSNSEEKTRN